MNPLFKLFYADDYGQPFSTSIFSEVKRFDAKQKKTMSFQPAIANTNEALFTELLERATRLSMNDIDDDDDYTTNLTRVGVDHRALLDELFNLATALPDKASSAVGMVPRGLRDTTHLVNQMILKLQVDMVLLDQQLQAPLAPPDILDRIENLINLAMVAAM